VAVTVNLEAKGKPLCMVLDVVEVAKVRQLTSDIIQTSNKSKSHLGINLTAAFAQILDEFGISNKVRIM
jgi:hypothetical protein